MDVHIEIIQLDNGYRVYLFNSESLSQKNDKNLFVRTKNEALELIDKWWKD